MNERFRELARRVVGKHRNDIGSISLFDQQIDQFAELIVRECVKLKHKNVIVGGVSEYNRGRRELSEDILKHFGVKDGN